MTHSEREIVQEAILNEANKLNHKIKAIAVCSNHVHVVIGEIEELIEEAVGRYKKAATNSLRQNGFSGRIWTNGFDKRYCFDDKELRARISYVNRHVQEKVKNHLNLLFSIYDLLLFFVGLQCQKTDLPTKMKCTHRNKQLMRFVFSD